MTQEPITAELMQAGDAAGVIAELAEKAALRQPLELIKGRKVGFLVPEGYELEEFDIDASQYLPQPERVKGSVGLTDPDSFVEYVNRHQTENETTLWSDVDRGIVIAVLNDHADRRSGLADAGWGDHRATLRYKLTEDWEHWAKYDGKLLDQMQFAEVLEDGARNVVSPSAADMLEIAQKFQGTRKVSYESGARIDNGEVRLVWQEDVEGKVGKRGQIEVPQTFGLLLEVFQGGGKNYPVTARFRYRIHDGGQVGLAYKLDRPDLVKLKAFNDLSAAISEGTGLPVLAGTPRP